MSDPISDFLARIRNAMMMRRELVETKSSRMLQCIAEILRANGYIDSFTVQETERFPVMSMRLKYDEKGKPVIEGLRRVSKPGLRIYAGSEELPRVRGGLGMAIVSTSRGVMTGAEAKKQHVGGEVICQVW